MQYNPQEKISKYIAISICLGTFVSAYCSVNISQITALFEKDNFTYQLTVSTAAFNLGNILGPLSSSYFVSVMKSHRYLLIILDFLSIIFLGLQLIEFNYVNLAVCRFFIGICVGISTTIVPAYIRGVMPNQIAGYAGTFNQLLQTMGVVICYIGGFWCFQICKSGLLWRLFIGFPIIILLMRLIFLGLIFPYDSFIFAYKRNKNRLRAYLDKVTLDAQKSLQSIEKQLIFQQEIKSGHGKQQRQLKIKKYIIISVLMISNQATGINAIIFYCKQLFGNIYLQSSYQTQFNNQIIITLLAVFQVISTLTSTFTIQKFGRKTILKNGQLIIIIILFTLLMLDLMDIKILIVILIFVHIFVHNWSLGSVCIIYASDLTSDLKYAIIILKICSFTVALTSQYAIVYLGIGYTFGIYGIISLICYLYLKQNLVETSSRSRQQIDSLLKEKRKIQKKIN